MTDWLGAKAQALTNDRLVGSEGADTSTLCRDCEVGQTPLRLHILAQESHLLKPKTTSLLQYQKEIFFY